VKIQAAMMSISGREEITTQTARVLLERGRLGDLCAPVLHHVATPEREGPHVPGWIVMRRELALGKAHNTLDDLTSARFKNKGVGPSPFDDFRAVMQTFEDDVPAIFFEDDVAPTQNACLRLRDLLLELPADCGVVSAFDLRNEWPRPGLFAAPARRDLWGAQALMFPGHVVTLLREQARLATELRSWDVWTGRAVERLGLRIYHYSPSLFQHVGGYSMYAPGSERPTAVNFPGDTFDALGPCPDPVPTGASAGVPLPMRCELHQIVHFGGATCARVDR